MAPLFVCSLAEGQGQSMPVTQYTSLIYPTLITPSHSRFEAPHPSILPSFPALFTNVTPAPPIKTPHAIPTSARSHHKTSIDQSINLPQRKSHVIAS